MTWTARYNEFTTLCAIYDGERLVAENVGKGDAERIVGSLNLSTEFVSMMQRSLDQAEAEAKMRAAWHEASRSMFSAEYYAHMKPPQVGVDCDYFNPTTGSDE